MALGVRVPIHTESLLLVAFQLYLSIDGVVFWHQSVFRPVENQSIALSGHRSDDVRVLWHIAGLVNLARVIDFLGDGETDWLFGGTKAA